MPKLMLITANVGSLFEPECKIHEQWINTVVQAIESQKADFVVMHMQEAGGKKYTECSEQVPVLIKTLSEQLPRMTFVRSYLDIEHEAIGFTALGVTIFATEEVRKNLYQYNFEKGTFESSADPNPSYLVVREGLEDYPYLRKEKFPKNFWPAIKWGRKGYILTKWKIHEKIFNFVDAHLFHDESNLALIHENPELYSDNRKRALSYMFDKIYEINETSNLPVFLFGDLNFRLDPRSFINKLTENTAPHNLDDADAAGSIADGLQKTEPKPTVVNGPTEHLRRTVSAIEFRRESQCNSDDSCVLRIEKKRFDYFNHKKLLNDWRSYLEDDKELQSFKQMHELPINFPPTYPWSEDPEDSEVLMKTRAPAWCDRVVMNDAAFSVVNDSTQKEYTSFGSDVCTGDHKPVFLSFDL